MNIASAIVVYLIAWWMIFFMVLPWGNAPVDDPELGHAASAPAKPRLRLKFLVTTAIATVVWLVIYLLIKVDVLDFYAMSEQMMKEDKI